jgi:hypothetical protein
MMEYLKNQAILDSRKLMARGGLHRRESSPPVISPETVQLSDVYRLLEREETIPHMWGLKRLLSLLGYSTGWQMGEPFLSKCRLGVLQFVPVQMLLTVVTAVCEWQNVYHEGRWSWSTGYAYITPIRAFSQGVALYCLVYFYHGTERLLAPINPLAKFLSIKIVIFFTFWQVRRQEQSSSHPLTSVLTVSCGRAECCTAVHVAGNAAHCRRRDAVQVLELPLHVLLQQL